MLLSISSNDWIAEVMSCLPQFGHNFRVIPVAPTACYIYLVFHNYLSRFFIQILSVIMSRFLPAASICNHVPFLPAASFCNHVPFFTCGFYPQKQSVTITSQPTTAQSRLRPQIGIVVIPPGRLSNYSAWPQPYAAMFPLLPS